MYRVITGCTAVRAGIDALAGFGDEVAAEIARLTNYPFTPAPNKSAAPGSPDAMIARATMRVLAVALMRIVNDLR